MNTRYGVSSQPAYLLLDTEGRQIVPTRGYDLSVEGYVDFLEEGIETYKTVSNEP